jgi:hypothetical protein
MAYCTHCGIQGNGNFCSNCGTPRSLLESGALISIDSSDGWENEYRYEALLRYPEVRNRLQKSSRNSSKRMTGEAWLELYDKAFKPFTGGVSMVAVASIVAPIYAQMGVKTGKKRREVIHQPIGRMIIAVLCGLAENNLPLDEVHQGEAGCVVEAKLPSDIFALEGQLVVAIEKTGNGTCIEAATNIPGQWFDWGKSTRCLDKLFGSVFDRAA